MKEASTTDREYYLKYLADALPDTLCDTHVHIWTKAHMLPAAENKTGTADWVHNYCCENIQPAEALRNTYTELFPGKKVKSLAFGWVEENVDLSANNRYVGENSKNDPDLKGLAVIRPEWPAEKLMKEVEGNGLIGVKPYPSFAPARIPADEVRITDMITRDQLAIADERGWVVVLHVPRTKRLADAANIEDILAIEKEFPHIRLIVAHIGRAYCLENIGEAFEKLKDTKNVLFDFAAHTNEEVFRRTLQVFGPGRLLFGSDLPISAMRLGREHAGGNYINIIPASSLGNVLSDPHMREVKGCEAEKITYFLYESVAAMLRAVKKEGLAGRDTERIFYRNAKERLGL